MVFMVPKVEDTVRQLKARGVVFEVYDSPGAISEDSVSRWSGEIAENAYRRTAWFKDSEGNLLNVAHRLDDKIV